MQELIAYKNGEFLPLSQCNISVMDLGITNAASVTDFVRTFNGVPFRLNDHVDRFYRAAKNAYLDPGLSKEEFGGVTRALVEKNAAVCPGAELGVIYYMTPGVNWTYAGSAVKPDVMTPTVIQHAFPLPFAAWKKFYTDGVRLATPSVPHLPPQCVSPQGKHRNRLHMWIGDHQLSALDPGVMGLYLDQAGNVTETGGSNFVIYDGKRVLSPRRRSILWGVSLTVLTELLAGMGIPFAEDDITVFDVVNAKEAWITTTPYCIAPVASLNGIAIGDGSFSLWRDIISRWSALVGKDLYAELTEA